MPTILFIVSHIPQKNKAVPRPPFEYEGRTYTAYQATQKQRSIERSIRKQKRLKTAYEAAGLKEDATAANIKLRRLNQKYKEFSKAAGLPEQRDRVKVLYSDQKTERAVETAKEKREKLFRIQEIQKKQQEKPLEQLKNAAGKSIIQVKHSSTIFTPDTITQRVGPKGGIDRNFYGSTGKQIVQISNNGHGHKKEEAMGIHGEHAHDYFWDEDGNLIRGEARELTEDERRDNDDFL